MLKKILPLLRYSIFICAITLNLATGVGAGKEEEQLDLSILQRRDELTSLMNVQQRSMLLSLEQQIEAGKSEIRTGQGLVQTKPSRLDPDKDIEPIIARGQSMIQSGQAKIMEAQKNLAAMLQKIDAEHTARLAALETKYDFTLGANSDYNDALKKSAQSLLNACGDANYETLLFGNLFVTYNGFTAPAEAKFRNDAYDVAQADGKRFNVSLPIGLKLTQGTDTKAPFTFTFEGKEQYKNEKLALISIEVIQGQNDEGLLYLRAIDINTHVLVAHAFACVKGLPSLFPAEAAATAPRIPTGVTIRDPNIWIDKLSHLEHPYEFAVTTDQIENPNQARVLEALLKHTLLSNSDLVLVESDFIRRAYATGTESPPSKATAILKITPSKNEEETNSFTISALAKNSGRVIEIGTMTLHWAPSSPADGMSANK